jgi:hypothetical protein
LASHLWTMWHAYMPKYQKSFRWQDRQITTQETNKKACSKAILSSIPMKTII